MLGRSECRKWEVGTSGQPLNFEREENSFAARSLYSSIPSLGVASGMAAKASGCWLLTWVYACGGQPLHSHTNPLNFAEMVVVSPLQLWLVVVGTI